MKRKREAPPTLMLGFDDDDPTLHQFVHFAFETGETEPLVDGSRGVHRVKRTLCSSDRLWFTVEILTDPDHPRFGLDRVDCPYCLMIARHQP